jgi:hypothetical protein
MNRRPPLVHCWRTKLEAVIEAHERVHGVGSFHGSKAWLSTMSPSWADGVCVLQAEHAGDCEYTGGEIEHRKAS